MRILGNRVTRVLAALRRPDRVWGGAAGLLLVAGAILALMYYGALPVSISSQAVAVSGSLAAAAAPAEAEEAASASDATVTPSAAASEAAAEEAASQAEEAATEEAAAGASPTQAEATTTTLPSWLVKQQEAKAAAAQAAAETTTTVPPAPEAPSEPAAAASTTAEVLGNGQTPLRGVWSGSAQHLADYLLARSPSPSLTVSAFALAEYYVRYCAEAGLRADLLWAQMLHETGYLRYGGAVSGSQNNYAGLGATGGSAPGLSFASAEAGVVAHVAHMVAYVYESSPVSWANSTTDPRFAGVAPKGAVVVLADLNGRWAVPGTTYGQSIENIVRAINEG